MKTPHMKVRPALLASAVLGVLLIAPSLRAEDTNTLEIIRQLQQRIEQLEQKVKTLEATKPPAEPSPDAATRQRVADLDQQVKDLKHDRELDAEAAEARAKDAPKISLGEQGFAFMSPNTNYIVQLKGVLQADSRTFFHDAGIVGNDSLLIRRARPILQGTVFRDFDFAFVPDFAGSSPQIFDAFVNYRYSPELQFQAGKYKAPIGLEYLEPDQFTFFNERALPTDLVPGRDIGFEVHGDLWGGVASYAVGIFNGVGDARNSGNSAFQDDKEIGGRVFFQPFLTTSVTPLKGFGFGVAGTYQGMQGTNTAGLPATTGGTLGGFTTDGQQQFFAYTNTVAASGDQWRISPQGYWYYGPFALLGEYVSSDQRVSRVTPAPITSRTLDNTAWQIAAGWVLTGEDALYNGPVAPRHPFNPANGGWGAFQVVGRYEELHVDSGAFPLFSDPRASARSADAWAVGLNWWLNRDVRVNFDYSHTWFEGGGISSSSSSPAAVTRKDENVLFTRVQLAF
jgi:phosphate-selective porin OprO/OprP